MPHLPSWIRRRRRAEPHPWWAAARWASRSLREAEGRLRHWLEHGIPANELRALAAMPTPALHVEPAGARPYQICASPSQQCNWQWHAWLQHLPEPYLTSGEAPSKATPPAAVWLNIDPLPSAAAALELLEWNRAAAVFDIDPERVACLRALNVPAQLLEPNARCNSWLNWPDGPAEASRRLGLAHPGSLDSASVLVLGTAGETWERSLPSLLRCWPGFEQVQLDTPTDARALAAWLNSCQMRDLQLVRLEPNAAERLQRGFQALQTPTTPHTEPGEGSWLPPQAFISPIDAETLAEELAWRRAGGPTPPPCTTPQPASAPLWEHSSGIEASAAICISLHNYADRITAALDSALAQQHQALELVVVDDASSDQGVSVVQGWLERHGSRFCRALLLRHAHNGGLAAARNSAFAACSAPWCFVLDADNRLLPEAVECCLTVAHAAPADAAVVHPLVEVVSDGNWIDPRTLVSGLSWQRQHLQHYNVVDAMALIRRSAWAAVGGFTHIPHGWEDYDFWCKLTGSGYHGVLCPQRLATYTSHGQSMIATSTQPHLRQISRMLQSRHPWLQLPYGQGLCEGWGQQP